MKHPKTRNGLLKKIRRLNNRIKCDLSIANLNLIQANAELNVAKHELDKVRREFTRLLVQFEESRLLGA